MAPERPTVDYRPRGAAAELFDTTASEVAISGPAGTGKSLACLWRILAAVDRHPGIRALIVRKTAVSLGSTTLVTFQKKVAASFLASRDLTWFGGSTREAASFRHWNGSVIVVGGMDKPEKILSSEYDLIFADEATELSLEDWETMGTRLRNNVLPWQQQIAACNPSAPTHWIKQRSDHGSMRMLHSRHVDNPAYVNADGTLTPAGVDYMGKLEALTGVRRERLFHGRWAAAEGLVYEGFDPAVHVVERLPEGSEHWARWWVVDFGYSNPFVCQFWAEDGDGRLWLYREIYKTQTLVEDHAKDILRIVRKADGTWKEPKPRSIICDHDAEDRATLQRHLGLGTIPAHKSVSDGVQAVAARLKVAKDGKPRVFFLRGALVKADRALLDAKKPVSTLEEIVGYVWPQDVKPDKRENPVKEDDHGMDCLRYMTAERDLRARPNIRWM